MIVGPLTRLARDQRGATLIEFAFACPIVVMLLIGAVQLGQMLHANAGMRHALGETARWIKVDEPNATDAAIKSEIEKNYQGLKKAQATAEVARSSNYGAKYVELTLTYRFDPEFVFFDVAPFDMKETRTVYLQD